MSIERCSMNDAAMLRSLQIMRRILKMAEEKKYQLGSDEYAAMPVPMWRQIGFSFCEIGGIPLYTMMLAYMTFFYSDVLKVNVGVIGVLTLISRIFDGISDIVAGNIVDHTHTSKGSAKPWIIRSGILMVICYFILFTVPNVGEVGKYIYFFISYNFGMTIAYTLWNGAANALPTYATTDIKSRSSMSAVRLIVAFIGQLVFAFAWLRMVAYFGNDQRAWIKSAAILGVIAFFATLVMYFTAEEHVIPSKLTGVKEDIPLGKAMLTVLKNKYWWIILGMWFINCLHQTTTMTVGTYYAEHILHDVKIAGNIMVYHNIAAIVSMLIIPYLLQKGVKKQNVMIFSSIIYIIGALVPIIAGGNMTTTILIVSLAFRGAAQGLNNSVVMGMLSDTVEYGEWKSGVRTQAVTVSASMVGLKLGSGIGTALTGVILSSAGYDGALAVQPASALTSINFLFVYVPLIIYIIQLILSLIYKLDNQMPQILKDLDVRRAERKAQAE
ncbi:MAG: MFS transporter [Lachnospiraceae bacterium]|nr:MFS transporter [Lachnospiraceae bacterium]